MDYKCQKWSTLAYKYPRASTWFEIQYGRSKIAMCGSKGKRSCNKGCTPKFIQSASTSTQVVGMWSLAFYSTLWHLSPSNKKSHFSNLQR
jgi:hypothetical protein